jgi:hypothetical protein
MGMNSSFFLVYELKTFNTDGVIRWFLNPRRYNIVGHPKTVLPGNSLLCLRQLKVGYDRIMVRPGEGKFPALSDRQPWVGQDVIYPQCRGYVDISTANAEAFFDIGVLPAAPDGEIGIRIGNIVEIPANHCRMRAFVQLCPYLFGLVSPQAKCITELFGDGTGGHEDAVVYILDDLDIVKVLALE